MSILKNIFLVDDDTDDQQFFIEALREIENANLCGLAYNGLEALHMLKNLYSLPDIIFLDCNMPVMNGIECLSEIMKTARIKDIPVIMLSTAIEHADTCRKLGAKGFIKKSFALTELKADLNCIINLGVIVNYVLTDSINSPSNFSKTTCEKT